MSIVGFGDFLMHFSPHDNDRFLQASSLDITFTGAEANVCAALGFWKEKVRFVIIIAICIAIIKSKKRNKNKIKNIYSKKRIRKR